MFFRLTIIFLLSLLLSTSISNAECKKTPYSGFVSFRVGGELFRGKTKFSIDREELEIVTRDTSYILKATKAGPNTWLVDLIRWNTGEHIDVGIMYPCDRKCLDTAFYIRWRKPNTSKNIDNTKDYMYRSTQLKEYALCWMSQKELDKIRDDIKKRSVE